MFFKFFCLFSALMDIIICIPSANYFFHSNRASNSMSSFSTNGHVSSEQLQNLLDITVSQKSVHGSPESHSFSDSNAPAIRLLPFTSRNSKLTKIFQNEKLLQQLMNEDAAAQTAQLHRERRGIVLIDEDFDVPPEQGVKQGWGNGVLDKNLAKSDEKDIDVMATEEGSGEPEEVLSTVIIHSTTPEQLQTSTTEIKVTPTNEYDKTISTLESADTEITSKHVDKLTSNMEPDKLTSNMEPDKLTSNMEQTEKLTSTSEHADKMVSTSFHTDKETSPVEYTGKLSSTTRDIEGSGEISLPFTQIPETTAEPEPEEQNEKSTLKVCLKRTCKSNDLHLSPGIERKVPEGTNLTLSCSSLNVSESWILKLYKYNISDSLLLEESNKEEKLNYQIPLSQRHHSGTYMCLKFTDESCCHQQLDITVYEVPNYRYHLIIVGIVAAIGFFICILLGIYRRFKTKNYEMQMELQNMEKPVLF